MLPFEVTILGNNSAFPAHGRFPSAQALNYNSEYFLIDCGEGTQMRLDAYGIKRSRINHIFISHLHGDHVFGLPGLINSYSHFGRAADLHIYGPKGIRQMIDTTLRLAGSMINFDLQFHEHSQKTLTRIHENKYLRVYAFPMKHRIPTFGYLFAERRQELNIRKEAIETYDLTVDQIKTAKAGEPVLRDNGTLIPNDKLTEPPAPLRKYAYCSDTIYDPDLVEWIRGSNTLYHESTFLHNLEDKAEISMHTTAFQAGMIARLAEVGRLLLGHFSSRYTDLDVFLDEASEAFSEVEIAREGETFRV